MNNAKTAINVPGTIFIATIRLPREGRGTHPALGNVAIRVASGEEVSHLLLHDVKIARLEVAKQGDTVGVRVRNDRGDLIVTIAGLEYFGTYIASAGGEE